jgi:transposase InsO family protein
MPIGSDRCQPQQRAAATRVVSRMARGGPADDDHFDLVAAGPRRLARPVDAAGVPGDSDTILTDEDANTSAACIAACQRLRLRRSMSRTGSCLDNAVADSWFASLKVELVDRAHWRTRAEARAAIFAWIAWYNRSRLHSARGYLPPVEWEQQHATISPLPSTMAA